MQQVAPHRLDAARKTGKSFGPSRRGPKIATDGTLNGAKAEPGLSLLFTPGHRPTAAEVRGLAERMAAAGDRLGGFALGHQPDEAAGWLELLVSGLSFDLTGLPPAPPERAPARCHTFGLDGPELPDDLEAVRLMPSPHIIGGAALPPVVRTITALAAALAQLDHVRAVCWHPAGTVTETALFVRIIGAWLEGGPFPSLGLTALVRDDNGGWRSEGLAFFTGQELRIEPDAKSAPSEARKLAVRLIHRLVEQGPIKAVGELLGPDGSLLDVEPSLDGRLLRIWRRS
jgi:hypothetical protein